MVAEEEEEEKEKEMARDWTRWEWDGDMTSAMRARHGTKKIKWNFVCI
jgi:hypothetical protein